MSANENYDQSAISKPYIMLLPIWIRQRRYESWYKIHNKPSNSVTIEIETGQIKKMIQIFACTFFVPNWNREVGFVVQ